MAPPATVNKLEAAAGLHPSRNGFCRCGEAKLVRATDLCATSAPESYAHASRSDSRALRSLCSSAQCPAATNGCSEHRSEGLRHHSLQFHEVLSRRSETQ